MRKPEGNGPYFRPKHRHKNNITVYVEVWVGIKWLRIRFSGRPSEYWIWVKIVESLGPWRNTNLQKRWCDTWNYSNVGYTGTESGKTKFHSYTFRLNWSWSRCPDTQYKTARITRHNLFCSNSVWSPLNTEGTEIAAHYDFLQGEIKCTQRTQFVSIDSYFMARRCYVA